MQINYTGHNVEVTAALQNVMNKKFARIKRHFNHDIISINVILSVQKLINFVETTVHIAGATIFAKGESDTMYKAIDDMMAKLEKQIKKRKGKQRGHN